MPVNLPSEVWLLADRVNEDVYRLDLNDGKGNRMRVYAAFVCKAEAVAAAKMLNKAHDASYVAVLMSGREYDPNAGGAA